MKLLQARDLKQTCGYLCSNLWNIVKMVRNADKSEVDYFTDVKDAEGHFTSSFNSLIL